MLRGSGALEVVGWQPWFLPPPLLVTTCRLYVLRGVPYDLCSDAVLRLCPRFRASPQPLLQCRHACAHRPSSSSSSQGSKESTRILTGGGRALHGVVEEEEEEGEEEDGPSITHTRMHNSNGRGDGGAEDVVMKLNGGMELGLSPATLSGGSDDEDFANAPPPNTDTITSSRSFFGQPLCLHPCVCHIAACLSFACARACAHTLLHSFTHPWLMRRHWTKRPE